MNRDRWRSAVWIVLISALPKTAAAEPRPQGEQELALEEAVAQAFLRSPTLAAAEAQLAEAAGRRTRAGTYQYNPTLQGSAAWRRGAGRDDVDFELGLSQQIEIAGQLGDRVEAAQSGVAAMRARVLRARRLLAARVHLAFVAALEARVIVRIAAQDLDLTERLHDLAARRLERGAGTQLDVNVAAAELGRAGARYQSADAAYREARAALAEVVGLSTASPPAPAGTLSVSLDPLPAFDGLIADAQRHRADLQALREALAATRALHELARAEAWPDLTVRAFGGREEGTDTLVGGALSIPIPLFDRNQGRIEETRAAIQRADADRRAGALSVTRQVVAAHARYDAAVRSATRLRELVLGTLEQNMELLRRSFEAGKATWPEVVVIRRSLIDAQRELRTAEAGARRAWIELQIASGRMPIPTTVRAAEEER